MGAAPGPVRGRIAPPSGNARTSFLPAAGARRGIQMIKCDITKSFLITNYQESVQKCARKCIRKTRKVYKIAQKSFSLHYEFPNLCEK